MESPEVTVNRPEIPAWVSKEQSKFPEMSKRSRYQAKAQTEPPSCSINALRNRKEIIPNSEVLRRAPAAFAAPTSAIHSGQHSLVIDSAKHSGPKSRHPATKRQQSPPTSLTKRLAYLFDEPTEEDADEVVLEELFLS
jgi:hypothetical protein